MSDDSSSGGCLSLLATIFVFLVLAGVCCSGNSVAKASADALYIMSFGYVELHVKDE